MSADERCDFAAEIPIASFKTFAHLVAGEPPYRDLLTSFGNFFCYQLDDSHGRILNEGLIDQHELFVELVQTPVNDF
jgi:hypothetical protein